MRVLAIDTALEACSAAVLDTGRGIITGSRSQPMIRGHAEALLPLIDTVMQEAETGFADLDRIAVTTGPGSFTGLRVGISAARGIALAANKPAVGLTTLAALAAPLIAADDSTAVACAIDARHHHVYLQVFGPAGRSVVAPRIVPATEAAQLATTAGPVRLIGSGAEAIAAHVSAPGFVLTVDARRAPEIGWVARLGAAADASKASAKPLYLRVPDAQPQDASQLPRR